MSCKGIWTIKHFKTSYQELLLRGQHGERKSGLGSAKGDLVFYQLSVPSWEHLLPCPHSFLALSNDNDFFMLFSLILSLICL